MELNIEKTFEKKFFIESISQNSTKIIDEKHLNVSEMIGNKLFFNISDNLLIYQFDQNQSLPKLIEHKRGSSFFSVWEEKNSIYYK